MEGFYSSLSYFKFSILFGGLLIEKHFVLGPNGFSDYVGRQPYKSYLDGPRWILGNPSTHGFV